MESNNPTPPKVDVYQIVTDRIISLLEKGTVPWQKPWNDAGIPMNLVSKRPYRGINLWLLHSLGYEHNLFLTWDQLKKLGASVVKGEIGSIVIYWRTFTTEEDESEGKKKPPILRYYKVFNISQCKDLPAGIVHAKSSRIVPPIHECESIIQSMPQSPVLTFKGKEAYYDMKKDIVVLPQLKSFKTPEGYYSTLFHELVHSTGHEKRLNRPTLTQMAEFGGDIYSIEELVAEMGAAYLNNVGGIFTNTVAQSAAYIKSWVNVLKNDKRFIIQASGQAQKAADFILNIPQPVVDSKDEIEQSEMLGEE